LNDAVLDDADLGFDLDSLVEPNFLKKEGMFVVLGWKVGASVKVAILSFVVGGDVVLSVTESTESNKELCVVTCVCQVYASTIHS
jgi:hypothetical protein